VEALHVIPSVIAITVAVISAGVALLSAAASVSGGRLRRTLLAAPHVASVRDLMAAELPLTCRVTGTIAPPPGGCTAPISGSAVAAAWATLTHRHTEVGEGTYTETTIWEHRTQEPVRLTDGQASVDVALTLVLPTRPMTDDRALPPEHCPAEASVWETSIPGNYGPHLRGLLDRGFVSSEDLDRTERGTRFIVREDVVRAGTRVHLITQAHRIDSRVVLHPHCFRATGAWTLTADEVEDQLKQRPTQWLLPAGAALISAAAARAAVALW
jgi:hypothetical protein